MVKARSISTCRGHAHALAVLLPPETHDHSFAMTSSFTAMLMAAWLAFCGKVVSDAHRRVRSKSVLQSHNEALKKLAGEPYSRVVYLGSNAFERPRARGCIEAARND